MMTPVSEDLLFKFFVNFSRFEFALKESGFVKRDKPEAQANWTMFADSLRSTLIQSNDVKFLEACTYILNYPPKKLMQENGTISGWSEQQPFNDNNKEPKAKFLLDMVRRVRNNLFHGNKLNLMSPDEDPDRSTKLLNYSLIILEECLRLNHKVQNAFAKQELDWAISNRSWTKVP